LAGRYPETIVVDTASHYYCFGALNPDQQAQAVARFSGYRLDAYRYALGNDGRIEHAPGHLAPGKVSHVKLFC
jgi:hypothetical protein